MTLYQPESGYCYNSDSLLLYDFINRFKPKGRVLDVGAGCGIVGLLVARDNNRVEMEAVEKQEQFVKYAQKNATQNSIKYKLYASNFLELEVEKKYDYIISNPPYYPVGTRESEDKMLQSARYNVNLPLDDFFKKVSRLLNPHSHFIFCYDPVVFGDICVALQKVKMRVVDVQFVHPRENKQANLVLIHARNSSKSMMKVSEPLFAFDGDKQSQKFQEIYKNAKTESIKCQL
jgi:tRNA1(Val) A37 N6-methylase TrmN6